MSERGPRFGESEHPKREFGKMGLPYESAKEILEGLPEEDGKRVRELLSNFAQVQNAPEHVPHDSHRLNEITELIADIQRKNGRRATTQENLSNLTEDI